MRSIKAFAFTAAVIAAFAAGPAAAQQLTVDWATPMMGTWVTDLTTPDGVVPVRMAIREQDGDVVVVLGNQTGEAPPITDVRRSGDSLVASYEMDYQGMMIDARITMQLEGEELNTDWSFADGMYATSAVARRES